MSQYVEVDGGKYVEFPDDMSMDEIKSAMETQYGGGEGGEPKTSAFGAGALRAAKGIIPGLAGAAGWAGAATLAPETGGLSFAVPLVASVASTVIGSKLQEKALESAAPGLKEYEEQSGREHPVAALAGDVAGALAVFEAAPGQAVKGLYHAGRAIGGKALTDAQKQAMRVAALQTGLGAGLGVVSPLLEGQAPTLAGVAESAGLAAVLGQPRIKALRPHVPTKAVDVEVMKDKVEQARSVLPNATEEVATDVGETTTVGEAAGGIEVKKPTTSAEVQALRKQRAEGLEAEHARFPFEGKEDVEHWLEHGHRNRETALFEAARQMGEKPEWEAEKKATAAAEESNEPFAASKKPKEEETTGRIAYRTKDGRLIFNRKEFDEWMSGIEPSQRAEAIDSLVSEEHIHGKTTDEDALAYRENATELERKIANMRYTGKPEGMPERFNETQMGHEMVRGMIQKLSGMTPREVFDLARNEQWKIKGLYALEKAIFNIRRALGTTANEKQLAILKRVELNIVAAKNAVMLQQNEGESAEAFNQRIRKAAEKATMELALDYGPRKKDYTAQLQAAMARWNVEPNGKVWDSGKIVDPTDEVVSRHVAEAQASIADRQKKIDFLKSLPPDASIKDIRAGLTADTSVTSIEEGLRLEENGIKSTQHYIEDQQLANTVFKEKTGAPEAYRLTRKKAADISKDLIEGGINAHGTVKITAESHGVPIELVRKIKATLMRGGKDVNSLLSYDDAIRNGWEDEHLGIVSPEAYNQRRKKAAEGTAELGLSFGKWTPEKGWESDKTAKPTGAEVGAAYKFDPKVLEDYAKTIIAAPPKQPSIFVKQATSEAPAEIKAQRKPTGEWESHEEIMARANISPEQVDKEAAKKNRPDFGEFEEWANRNHPQIKPDQLREMWQGAMWQHLMDAPAARINELIDAFGLRGKYKGTEIKEAGATPVKAERPEVAKITAEHVEADKIRAQAARFDARAKSVKKLEGKRVEKQLEMVAELGLEEAYTSGELKEIAKELRAKADTIEARETAGEDESGIGYKPGVKGFTPRNIRLEAISDIADMMARDALPKVAPLERPTFTVEDIDFSNPRADVTPVADIKPGTTFVHGKSGRIQVSERITKLLKNFARVSSSDPASWTKRLVALRNKETGDVVVTTVFNDGNAGLKIMEPTGGRGIPGEKAVLLTDVYPKWEPFMTMLDRHSRQNFRQHFKSMDEFNAHIGDDLKRARRKELYPAPPTERGEPPPSIADEANADALLAEEKVDPAQLEAEVAGRYEKSGAEAGMTEVTEGEGGDIAGGVSGPKGPIGKTRRAEMGFGRGQIGALQKSNQPLRSEEVNAIMDFATDELAMTTGLEGTHIEDLSGVSTPKPGRIVESRMDMLRVVEELAARAEAGTLRQRDWNAINGIRKMARNLFNRERARIAREREDLQSSILSKRKLAQVKMALGLLKFPDRQSAYKEALMELFDIYEKAETHNGFVAEAMERLGNKTRQGGGLAGEAGAEAAVSPTARELELKRTVLRKGEPGQLPSEVEVPALTPKELESPWGRYEQQFRREAINSDDPYERWLARYSRQVHSPMPLGGVRGTLTGAPAFNVPDMTYVERMARDFPVEPLGEVAPGSPEVRARGIDVSPYGMGERPGTVPTKRTPLSAEAKRMQLWHEAQQPLNRAQLRPSDTASPEAFNRAKERVKATAAEAKHNFRLAMMQIQRGDPVRALKDWQGRRGIMDVIYSLFDSMDNEGDAFSLATSTEVKLASMDPGPALKPGMINRIKTARQRRRAEKVGEERRLDAMAAIAAKVHATGRDGKKLYKEEPIPGDTFGNTIRTPIEYVQVSKTNSPYDHSIETMISQANTGIAKAREMMAAPDLRRRSIGKRWLAAAEKLKAAAQRAGKQNSDAILAGSEARDKWKEEVSELKKAATAADKKYEDAVNSTEIDPATIPGLEAASMEANRKYAEAEARSKEFRKDAFWSKHPLKRTMDAISAAFKEDLDFKIANGIFVTERENYIPGRHDGEVFNDGLFSWGEMRMGHEYRKPKTFANYWEAIANGPYLPKTFDPADLVQSTVRASRRMIGRRMWEASVKGVTDPKTGEPVAMDPKYVRVNKIITDPESGLPTEVQQWVPSSPKVGYQLVYPNNDKNLKPLAVKEPYYSAVKTAVSPSWARNSTAMQVGLGTASALKHGVILILDSFHPFRLGQYALALGGWGKKGRIGFEGGYSALNFRPESLDRAVEVGWITKEASDWAKEVVEVNDYRRGPRPEGFGPTINKIQMSKQDIAQLGISRFGLNASRIVDAMYRNAVQNIPIIGRKWHDMLAPTNRLIFDKITTGLMVESFVHNFERINKANPTMPWPEVMKKTATDINVMFGNMGRQGIFKDQTFRDIASILLLAPMWREGLIQKDVRVLARTGKFGVDVVKKALGQKPDVKWGDLPQFGTLGRAYARGLLAYFVGTQMINLATRHHFTWQNPEEDHKMDAWFQIGSTGGAWLSPMSVFGEVIHDALRMMDARPTWVQAVGQMGSNAMGPVGKMGKALFTGEDPQGSKATSSLQWVKNAAAEIAPAPITLAYPFKAAAHWAFPSSAPGLRPGEFVQRAGGIVGIKMNLPKAYQSQIRALVKKFNEEENLPPNSVILEPTDQPSYSKLTLAIRNNDAAGAKRLYKDLVETYVEKHRTRGEGIGHAINHIREVMQANSNAPWTGNKAMETQFLAWAYQKPNRLELLHNARMERVQELSRFLELEPSMVQQLF